MSEQAQNPWFKRKLKGIITPSREKKETPDGFWHKTPSGDVIEKTELKENFFVTPKEGYHVRIGSKEYFDIIFDDQKFTLIADDLTPKDKLKFKDKKKYSDRIKESKKNPKRFPLSKIPKLVSGVFIPTKASMFDTLTSLSLSLKSNHISSLISK